MKHPNLTPLLKALILINSIVFLFLSLLHFYWGFGGTRWFADVLPTNSTGSKRMEPGTGATFIVAFVLLLLAFVTFSNGIPGNRIKRPYSRYGALLISILFFIRAVGDFKFVGFFKTVKATPFAVNDTRLFSPLCLLVAVISLLIFYKTRGINDE
jgi:hypothetical protein